MISKLTKKIVRTIKKIIKYKVNKSENPVKWGIIGTGYMAETFGEAIDSNVNGILSAVASRTVEKAISFASKYGHCEAYGSYKEIVEDSNIDIIYIATPIRQHYDNIKLCLSAGKNVLCEKPIVTNVEQLEELQKLAIENNCFFMEGMWMKCLPTYQKALEWINEGKIGIIDLIKVDFYKREMIDTSKVDDISNKDGGVLLDYGVYAVSFPIDFMETNLEIQGYSRKSLSGMVTDWMIHIHDYKVQAFLNISSNFASQSKAAVIGDKGTIEWNHQFNRTNIIVLYNKFGKQIEKFKTTYEYEGFEYEVDEVQNCIKSGFIESKKVSVASSLSTLTLIDKLLQTLEVD